MIYDISYPGTRDFDSGVVRLDLVSKGLKARELAIAKNTNWDRHTLYNWGRTWLSEQNLPKEALSAYGLV